jgi:hypothetical protein
LIKKTIGAVVRKTIFMNEIVKFMRNNKLSDELMLG